ncbi:MAG: DUF374 domain-containing protein, partial [Planctomycetaceae bacterium]
MRIRSRALTVVAGWTAAMVFRALACTLRYKVLPEERSRDPADAVTRTYIYALWHDEILAPLAKHALIQPKVAALVSRHQDGSYLTEFMKRSGIRAVRGSSARGGDQALLELLRVPEDFHVFITPDGPRGPHHELKSGIIYLASRTGRPIVPLVSVVPRSWYLKGKWTGLVVPKPFANCYFRLGQPYTVPADASREQIEFHRLRLQQEM